MLFAPICSAAIIWIKSFNTFLSTFVLTIRCQFAFTFGKRKKYKGRRRTPVGRCRTSCYFVLRTIHFPTISGWCLNGLSERIKVKSLDVSMLFLSLLLHRNSLRGVFVPSARIHAYMIRVMKADCFRSG